MPEPPEPDISESFSIFLQQFYALRLLAVPSKKLSELRREMEAIHEAAAFDVIPENLSNEPSSKLYLLKFLGKVWSSFTYDDVKLSPEKHVTYF
jgi:hypothetical protein